MSSSSSSPASSTAAVAPLNFTGRYSCLNMENVGPFLTRLGVGPLLVLMAESLGIRGMPELIIQHGDVDNESSDDGEGETKTKKEKRDGKFEAGTRFHITQCTPMGKTKVNIKFGGASPHNTMLGPASTTLYATPPDYIAHVQQKATPVATSARTEAFGKVEASRTLYQRTKHEGKPDIHLERTLYIFPDDTGAIMQESMEVMDSEGKGTGVLVRRTWQRIGTQVVEDAAGEPVGSDDSEEGSEEDEGEGKKKEGVKRKHEEEEGAEAEDKKEEEGGEVKEPEKKRTKRSD